MSYGVCAFDPALVPLTRQAGDVWSDEHYHATSQPDTDLTARKWRIKEALLAFNPALVFFEPNPPPGALARLFKTAPRQPTSLSLVLPVGEDEEIDFEIFDDAVEVELPYEAADDEARQCVEALWRHLHKISELGLSTLYDTERDTLLKLETDFDAVLQHYLDVLRERKDGDGVAATPSCADADVTPRAAPAPQAQRPFTGNLEAPKPWWKIW